MTDPDDVARAKRFERLRNALSTAWGGALNVDASEWVALEHALLAWQAQVAIDKEQRRRDKEAHDA